MCPEKVSEVCRTQDVLEFELHCKVRRRPEFLQRSQSRNHPSACDVLPFHGPLFCGIYLIAM